MSAPGYPEVEPNEYVLALRRASRALLDALWPEPSDDVEPWVKSDETNVAAYLIWLDELPTTA